MQSCVVCVFFFNDTATTEIYTLSLHDALSDLELKFFSIIHPTRAVVPQMQARGGGAIAVVNAVLARQPEAHMVVTSAARDRKSTRLNSSHANISYAVFCLKKKKYLHWLSPSRL